MLDTLIPVIAVGFFVLLFVINRKGPSVRKKTVRKEHESAGESSACQGCSKVCDEQAPWAADPPPLARR
ncbi:MAG: hypothetical protein HQM13_14185 [SAR324 cluster bacterium]|nr:hypothetical protein [SAR324 cluster bacterium]